jgi:hypothetical protein
MNGKRLRNQDDRGYQKKTEEKETGAQQNRIPLSEVWHVDERVRSAQAANRSTHKEKRSAHEQCSKDSGAPPVEPFPLCTRSQNQRKTSTRV